MPNLQMKMRTGTASRKHTQEEVWADRDRFLAMPLMEKRQYYIGFHHATLQQVKPWPQYFAEHIPPDQRVSQAQCRYNVNTELNDKVSVWGGDITSLEVDAIVNSGTSVTVDKGGKVNQSILERAGPYYRDECIMALKDSMIQEGGVMIVAGHMLPAKYVINTLAPKKQDDHILLSCYRNSLEAAKNLYLRTIAFPCISTRKRHGFPLQRATHLALTAVRKWLHENHEYVDRIIFCLYTKEDMDFYNTAMQEFFPSDTDVTQPKIRANERMDQDAWSSIPPAVPPSRTSIPPAMAWTSDTQRTTYGYGSLADEEVGQGTGPFGSGGVSRDSNQTTRRRIYSIDVDRRRNIVTSTDPRVPPSSVYPAYEGAGPIASWIDSTDTDEEEDAVFKSGVADPSIYRDNTDRTPVQRPRTSNIEIAGYMRMGPTPNTQNPVPDVPMPGQSVLNEHDESKEYTHIRRNRAPPPPKHIQSNLS